MALLNDDQIAALDAAIQEKVTEYYRLNSLNESIATQKINIIAGLDSQISNNTLLIDALGSDIVDLCHHYKSLTDKDANDNSEWDAIKQQYAVVTAEIDELSEIDL